MANKDEGRKMIASKLDDSDRERLKGIVGIPGYKMQCEKAAAFAACWEADHPGAVLRWHELTGTFLVCALDEHGRGYLAASPDADALLRDLDVSMGGVLTVMQAYFALSFLGWVK